MEFSSAEKNSSSGVLEVLVCEALQGIFIAGQRTPVDEDVESRIFSLDNDIETGCHRIEFSGDIENSGLKSAPGNPINQRSDSETQDYTSFIRSR